MKHKLKIFPAFFDAVVSGEKNFEVRDNNDRGFKHGDIVRLCEFTKEGMYTGREIEKRITYVSNYGQLDGYVVFGMADVVPNGEFRGPAPALPTSSNSTSRCGIISCRPG